MLQPFQIHKEVSSASASPVTPELPNALALVNMITYDAESGGSHEEKELFSLLCSPHISVSMQIGGKAWRGQRKLDTHHHTIYSWK